MEEEAQKESSVLLVTLQLHNTALIGLAWKYMGMKTLLSRSSFCISLYVYRSE
jgi:hypothetical protein